MPILKRFTEPFSAERQALELEAEHIEGFRRSQSLAYASALAIEKELREGMTERQATNLMAQFLADHGVHEYFHTPFAWFGERTAFKNFKSDMDFAPSERRLEAGEPVILDVAPFVDGHASDIGYACVLGHHTLHAQMRRDLLEYRSVILDGVKAGRTRRTIYEDVDQLIQKHGYQNRHQRYPDRVLGHRVTWTPPNQLSRRTVMGFGLQTFGTVMMSKVLSRVQKDFQSPLWNDAPSSNSRVTPGLWAIEPHLGFRGIGAKWEEILVVTHDDAYWLDDEVPHLREKASAGERRNGNGAARVEPRASA